MAKANKTKRARTDKAAAANAQAPKNPRDAARQRHQTLLKSGTAADRQAKIAELQGEIEELSQPPYTEFPKMKYHPDQPATIVNDAEQEQKLGSGWVDSLADLPDVKARLKGTKAAEGPAKVAHDETAAGRGR